MRILPRLREAPSWVGSAACSRGKRHPPIRNPIREAKELGFTLAEIKELLSLKVDPSSWCGDVKSRAEVKIGNIEEKLWTLQRMKRALGKLTKASSGDGLRSVCPILESLDGKGRR